MTKIDNFNYFVKINDLTIGDNHEKKILDSNLVLPPMARHIEDTVEGRDGTITRFDAYDDTEYYLEILLTGNKDKPVVELYDEIISALYDKYAINTNITSQRGSVILSIETWRRDVPLSTSYDTRTYYKNCRVTNVDTELLSDNHMLVYIDFTSEPFWNLINHKESDGYFKCTIGTQSSFRNNGVDTNDYILTLHSDTGGGTYTINGKQFSINTFGRAVFLHGRNGLILDDINGDFIQDVVFEGELPTIKHGNNSVRVRNGDGILLLHEKHILPIFRN